MNPKSQVAASGLRCKRVSLLGVLCSFELCVGAASAIAAAASPARIAQDAQPLQRSLGAVVDLAISTDGRRLAAAYFRPGQNRPGTDWGATVVTWDLSTGERTILPAACAPVAISPDGRWLACGRTAEEALFDRGNAYSAKTWPAVGEWGGGMSFRDLVGVPPIEGVAAVTFSGEGKDVLALATDGRLLAWSLDAGAEAREIDRLEIQSLTNAPHIRSALPSTQCNLCSFPYQPVVKVLLTHEV